MPFMFKIAKVSGFHKMHGAPTGPGNNLRKLLTALYLKKLGGAEMLKIFLAMPVIWTDLKIISVRTIKYTPEILIFCQSEWNFVRQITGGNLPWFWVRMCGWSPRTPPHSYTRPSEKHDPFIYFPYRKLTPFIYYFRKLTPFIYYFSNFTHSYTFGVKKIPHWYTFDVKMIPIHILGGLKSIPHSSRTSVYTFIMEVTPPPPPPWDKSFGLTLFDITGGVSEDLTFSLSSTQQLGPFT